MHIYMYIFIYISCASPISLPRRAPKHTHTHVDVNENTYVVVQMHICTNIMSRFSNLQKYPAYMHIQIYLITYVYMYT